MYSTWIGKVCKMKAFVTFPSSAREQNALGVASGA